MVIAGLAALVTIARGYWDRQEFEPRTLTSPGHIRAEVLNGCGRPGAGMRVTRILRDAGVDVLEVGNSDSFSYTQTVIVDRCGDGERAAFVREVLGIGRVIQQVDPSLLLDVTVIVGHDLGAGVDAFPQ